MNEFIYSREDLEGGTIRKFKKEGGFTDIYGEIRYIGILPYIVKKKDREFTSIHYFEDGEIRLSEYDLKRALRFCEDGTKWYEILHTDPDYYDIINAKVGLDERRKK